MIVGHPWRRRAHVTAVIVVGLLMAAPFYWLIINSLKTAQEVVGYPPTWFPHDIRWQNIADALDLLSVQSVINSLIFTVSVTICQLILVIMTGFAIAKMPFPGRTPLLWLYIIMCAVWRCYAVYRRRRLKIPVHSRYSGRPWLHHLMPNRSELTVKRIEPLIVFLFGLVMVWINLPLAGFLVAGAIGQAMSIAITEAMNHAKMLDQQDALIEQGQLADRSRDLMGR